MFKEEEIKIKKRIYMSQLKIKPLDYKVQIFELYNEEHKKLLPLSQIISDKFLINKMLSEEACLMGVIASKLNLDAYNNQFQIDTDFPGIIDYQLNRKNEVLFWEDGELKKIHISAVCQIKNYIKKFHPVIAFELGLYFGAVNNNKNLDETIVKNLFPN